MIHMRTQNEANPKTIDNDDENGGNHCQKSHEMNTEKRLDSINHRFHWPSFHLHDDLCPLRHEWMSPEEKKETDKISYYCSHSCDKTFYLLFVSCDALNWSLSTFSKQQSISSTHIHTILLASLSQQVYTQDGGKKEKKLPFDEKLESTKKNYEHFSLSSRESGFD